MKTTYLGGVIGLALFAACAGPLDPGPGGPSPARTCSADFTISGTFTATAPRPAANLDGCWPIGTWKFTAAAVAGSDTCSTPPVPLAGGYQFEGDLVTDQSDPQGPPIETFTYDTDPSVMSAAKVTEGGAGSCSGELDLYSADCTKVWEFQPETDTTDPTTTISGQAEYSEYRTSMCP